MSLSSCSDFKNYSPDPPCSPTFKTDPKSDVVLDGYYNPLQALSHSFSLKLVFLVMKRRRWKEGGTDKHYSNEYELTNYPSKLTADMAGFLKI